jgi:hypothetical protein
MDDRDPAAELVCDLRARSRTRASPLGSVREEVGALGEGRRAIDEEHEVVFARITELEDRPGLDDQDAP